MTRDEAIKAAAERGLIVRPCHDENLVTMRMDKVPDDRKNERMRITTTGPLLIVHEGYYWQAGTTADLIRHLEDTQ